VSTFNTLPDSTISLWAVMCVGFVVKLAEFSFFFYISFSQKREKEIKNSCSYRLKVEADSPTSLKGQNNHKAASNCVTP
jgi:hypothetical protein